MITILYLVRHGETDWNANRRWQGHADIPLNSRGLQQARLLAECMKARNIRFDAIYSSDLTRAYQTAWQIGAALKVAVQLLPPLRELDVGAWCGLTRDDIRVRYPVEYRLLDEGQDIPRGGAETLSALQKRVTESVAAMVAQHPGETLALVMHGGSIRALLKYVHQQNGTIPHYEGHLGNTSVTILECPPAVSAWNVVTYNNMYHLETCEAELHLMSSPPDDSERPQEWNP